MLNNIICEYAGRPVLESQRVLGGRLQRLASTLVGKPSVWLVFIVTLFSLPILRSIDSERDLSRLERPVLGVVRDFTLRDQNDSDFGTAELRGRIWVASFTAIACEPTCLQSQRMLTQMAELRHRTRNLGDAIRHVTFRVDPERDTGEPWRALSATYRARGGTWRFVSGSPDRVSDVLRDFPIAEGTSETRVALVDGNLQIRGYYDLADEAALPVLLRDIGLLISVGGP
jgi:protein SCO1